MAIKARKTHTTADFDLDVLASDLDMFRWFLLCYLFGKLIRSETATATWQLFVSKKLDTPWAIDKSSEHELARAQYWRLYALSACHGTWAEGAYRTTHPPIRRLTALHGRK